MTEKSLRVTGHFGVRLDPTKAHYPQPVPENAKRSTVCQLHRYANKVLNEKSDIPKGARDKVMICGDCNAAVCLKCWSTFHSTEVFSDYDFCEILSNNN